MQRGAAILLLGVCLQGAVEGERPYTTNAICLRRHCVNPIFPALEDLGRLSEAPWYCTSLRKARPFLGFCNAALNYDPAFPLPEGANQQTMEDIVQRQDGEAAKMFMYHLSGMGIEAWDYAKPELSDDDCVKSVWRMVCYTYFPRAPIGCQEGMQTPYLRPCKSCCQNYIKTCGVECCDESVQCVFSHTKQLSMAESITTSGYLPHDGPSTLCTGGTRRASPGLALRWLLLLPALLWSAEAVAAPGRALEVAAARLPRLLQLASFAVVPLLLQGCTLDVPSHVVGNWRAEPDYLIGFQYVPPGGSARDGMLNSCEIENLPLPLQCSGRGACKTWDQENLHSPTTFCECDRDWADPECKTRRKSQLGAFLLSMFLGFLGADRFYMGLWISGTLKLLTLGGGGTWWIYDFIRVGSAPVGARNFRLAGDLPHWVFLLLVVSFGMVLGFAVAYSSVRRNIVNQRKDALMHAEEEEAYYQAPEKKHVPRRPEHPQLLIGEPGMQLKFKGAGAGAYPSYGAVPETRAAEVPSSEPFNASYILPAKPSWPTPAVTKPEVAFENSGRGSLSGGPSPVPTGQPPVQTFGGPVQAPPPTLGLMEPVAGTAMSLQGNAVGPRVDVVSPRGTMAASQQRFIPSSIAGLEPTSRSLARHN